MSDQPGTVQLFTFTPKWEYLVRRSDDLGSLQANLNDLGSDGWELCAGTGDGRVWVLKRPLENT